jgi:hypothetical protein
VASGLLKVMGEAMTTTTSVIDAAIAKRPGSSRPWELVEFARSAVTHPAGVDVLRAICATNCDLELMRYRALITAWLAHAEYAELYQDTPGPEGLTWAMARLIDAVIKQEQWSRLRLTAN